MYMYMYRVIGYRYMHAAGEHRWSISYCQSWKQNKSISCLCPTWGSTPHTAMSALPKMRNPHMSKNTRTFVFKHILSQSVTQTGINQTLTFTRSCSPSPPPASPLPRPKSLSYRRKTAHYNLLIYKGCTQACKQRVELSMQYLPRIDLDQPKQKMNAKK